jgi:hypothetical protein
VNIKPKKGDYQMADATPNKAKATRRAAGPKPVFVVFQVLDESGQPIEFPKDRINLIVGTRNAAEALEVMDGGKFVHATYKKVMVGK